MQSKATTVAAYLASLPADRRAVVAAVRDVFRANLDAEYAEGMSYGMIAWCVPLSVYPAGYHCNPKQPLPFAALAAQKNYYSLYVMSLYGGAEEERWLRAAWQKAGKKLDMGKCCIRFKHLDDVPLDVLAQLLQRIPARAWVAHYQACLDPRTGKPRSERASKAGAKKAAKKATKKAAKKAAKRATRKAAPRAR